MRLIRPLAGFRAGRTSRVGQAFSEKKRSVRAKGWHMEPVCISKTGSWGNVFREPTWLFLLLLILVLSVHTRGMSTFFPLVAVFGQGWRNPTKPFRNYYKIPEFLWA